MYLKIMVRSETKVSVNIAKSQKMRIRRLLDGKFKGDYNGVDEFVREAVRFRLIELGAYDEDLDDDDGGDDVV